MKTKNCWLYLMLLSTVTISACTGRVYKIDSFSMEPGLRIDSYITVVPTAITEFERGDIVVYEIPWQEDATHAKRIIGLPGETVEIHDGAIYIDGEILEEPYPVEPFRFSEVMEPKTLEDDEYFVLGDNRPNSSDSRRTGPVAADSILGKVVITPWNQFLNLIESN